MWSLRIGDVVRVSRACLGNPERSLALVVEVYPRAWRGDDQGVTLQFENGSADGFSSEDLALWGVARVGHVPHLARYEWRSASQLDQDFRRGMFAVVWTRAWV
jgi:hypothetical protein